MAGNPSDITYEVLPQSNATFWVRVSDGKSVPTVVPGFHSEVEAHKWILEKRRGNLRRIIDKLHELGKLARARRSDQAPQTPQGLLPVR
jgi:hypothetical protein